MIWIFLQIIWITLLTESLGEPPTSSCIKPKPFKTRFNTCANFTEICVKNDDIDCNNLLSSCQDCPTSQISVLLLQDVIKIIDKMQNEIQNLSKKTDKLDVQRKEFAKNHDHSIKIILYLLIAIVISMVVLLFLLLVEVRFKIITKCLENCTGKGEKRDYRRHKVLIYGNKEEQQPGVTVAVLEEVKNEINQHFSEQIDQKFTTNFEVQSRAIDAKIEEKMNTFCNSIILKIEDKLKDNSSSASILELPTDHPPSETRSIKQDNSDESDMFFSLNQVPD